MMQTPVVGNGWRIKDNEILVVRDGLKQIIGPNLLDEFGISVTQILNPIEGYMINNIQYFPYNILAKFFPIELNFTTFKIDKYNWTEEHTTHFNAIKIRFANHIDNVHYNLQFETRVKYEAYLCDLGAALGQLTVKGWKPILFASRMLNFNDERYSIHELEIFGEIWFIKYFKTCLYGKDFSVIIDHRALL